MLLSSRTAASTRIAGVLTLLLLTACGDAAVTAPEAPPESLCNSIDCNTFRSLGPTGLSPTITNASRVSRALRNASLGAQLSDRITSVQSDLAAGRNGEARATLLQVIASIDAAIGTTTNAADWPDLSAIRLNLEPVKVYLRIK